MKRFDRRSALGLLAMGALGGLPLAAGAGESVPEEGDGQWAELAHWLYGQGFWYADPLEQVKDLNEEQLYWVPEPKSLCLLWQVGHIAHREREHIGRMLQGLPMHIIPARYHVFGCEWHSVAELRASVDSVERVFDWVREVRRASHEYIDSLSPEDWSRVPPTSAFDLSVAHWVFITTAHTALHFGKIQLLRAMMEGREDPPC